MKDLKQLSDYVQNSLVSLIEKIHSNFEVPLKVYKNEFNSLYFSISTQADLVGSCFANHAITDSTCDVKRIDIETSSLVLHIPEYLFMTSPMQSTIEEIMINPMNLENLSTQFIDTNKSVLVIGSTRVSRDEASCRVVISTRIGLGVSYKLKEKIQSHCRQKCNKFMRCILKPEECNLAYIMRALK